MRYAWIEGHRDAYPAARMCRLLNVSRTGYLQWRTRPPSDRTLANAALDAQVAVIHAESRQSYGRPRIVRALHAHASRSDMSAYDAACCGKHCDRSIASRIA